jgi:hypothetical protein
MDYELRDGGGQRVATLRFRSPCGSQAWAETSDGRWTFKRVGFFRPRITVRVPRHHEDLAVFHPAGWSGSGRLEAPDGRRFEAHAEPLREGIEIRSAEGVPLIQVRPVSVLNAGADATVLEAARDLPELPWLACLAWYLVVIRQMETAVLMTASCTALAT